MRARAIIGFLSVAVATLSSDADASVDVWKGTYNVTYNHGTGTMTLQEGRLPSYVDNEQGLIGTLVLQPNVGTHKTTCTLEGPKSASVRGDRTLLKGTCMTNNRREYRAFYLAKAPNAFHGYFTVSTAQFSAGGVLGAVEQSFDKLSLTTAIWGSK
jgi:hypothetical protein